MFGGGWPGHSRAMLEQLDTGGNSHVDLIGKSTIPRSQMVFRWENEVGFNAPDARLDIADWELLVITERVPMSLWQCSNPKSLDVYNDPCTGPGSAWFNASAVYMQTWAEHAWSNGNSGAGTPTMLYATWTDLAQGEPEWRLDLDVYQPLWERWLIMVCKIYHKKRISISYPLTFL